MCKPKIFRTWWKWLSWLCHFWHLTVWSSHTHSCRNHPIIGTAPWFSYMYTKHKSHSFVQTHLFQSYQVVPMACICQCHQRCNHPTNHRHYPMVSKFGSLKTDLLFWQFLHIFKSGRFFAVNTPSTPTFAVNACCFCHVLVCPCFKWLSNRTKLWAFTHFLVDV